MTTVAGEPSTGIPSLDRVFQGLRWGDNVVWQVDSIEDYAPFMDAYLAEALRRGRKIIYFRFAKHRPLVEDQAGVDVHQLHPETGFESFISEIRSVAEEAGRGASYIFDCLSELVVDWYSDRMLGNFFMLTCPYLYDRDTIAYFAVLRNLHSFHATTPISQTTQLFVDVFRHRGKLYVHPVKVQQRHSPTMYMLHGLEDGEFQPVTQSVTITEIISTVPWSQLDSASTRREYWDRTFEKAEELQAAIQRGERPDENVDAFTQRLLRMAIARHGRILHLASKYLGLPDILEIRRRMVGTGLIGGKSVGMLLARAILRKTDPQWAHVLEPHDSFFVGADEFYTYLVQNGLWWVKQKQKDPQTYLDGAEEAREKVLNGDFPEHIIKQFADMLDYFGQSPIIVRSSSLLEDNFGNAFAGKYESLFCVNQGSRDRRLEDFTAAVRRIYASTMSHEALQYRAKRGLLGMDEQMALLVQRVSGSIHGHCYLPEAAGVGLSFNPYVWNEHIDPAAGVLRLVFGLGTRAVDRFDDDYTRVVALNAPQRRPEADPSEVRRYAQRKVDVLDLASNEHASRDFADVAKASPHLPVELFASHDLELERLARERNLKDVFPWYLTFDKLLEETTFVKHMRTMLRVLQEVYEYPVDIEFTTNFLEDGSYRINLVQCRPLQVKGGGAITAPPAHLPDEDRVLESQGPVIGHSRMLAVDRLIYIVPSVYGQLPLQERYTVSRVIGQLVHGEGAGEQGCTMLLGPGRWGTKSPDLGVPVSFAEINTVNVICEIVAMREGLVPDVSLGTHFFNELVEMDILYLAFFPDKQGSYINGRFFEETQNRLPEVLPKASRWAEVIRVIFPSRPGDGRALKLNADALKQRVVCYLERTGKRERP